MNPGQTFDLMGWFGNHGTARTREPLDKLKVIAALKAQGITSLAAVQEGPSAISLPSIPKRPPITHHPFARKSPAQSQTEQKIS
uniref:Uncharacterized protein n=1 Tax=Mycena chlorophos TaxID=658473 RepID=A0ABQ0KUL9_MYCCL|nr:predicted protein [Mycena chlorophos]